MPCAPDRLHRRSLLLSAAAAVAAPQVVRAAGNATPLPPMTEGPFYPQPAWRARGPFAGDWDADLTRVQRGGETLIARGEHLGLDVTVVDAAGRLIDGAEVEIWQCDALAAYRHPAVTMAPAQMDPGFQGFGAARSDATGAVRFRTIRPVPYPGRTPHIHVKLRHASFGEWTSQLFLAGDPGNARDFLWRQLDAPGQSALALQLRAAPADSGLRWQALHALVVPQ